MQRHRNPANGYRSNPMGIGGGGGGGGIAAGGPGYRSYNRGGFGRGQPPPPRRIDVFMEAGKLATEYLVSKGLLPPNSLNGKWQNSNLKNQIGGGDGVSDAVSGTGSGRRRFADDYSSATGSRDGIRARRTIGSFKNPALELNREVNRSSSLSEKVKGVSDKQGDGDSFSGSMEEQKSGKDGAGEDQKSVSGDLESKSYDAGNLDAAITNQQNQSPDESTGIKTPISEERNDSLKNINMSTDDVAMDDGNQESEKPVVSEDPPEEDNNKTPNNNSSDLLTLIRFNKIPTRTRSSVTLKGSKSDPVLISGVENSNKQDDENQGLNHELELKIEQVPSEADHKYEFGQELPSRSLSFPQRSSVSDQELSEGPHGYTRSRSALLGGGEKRPLQINDSTESAKKPRDWASADPQADDYLHISSLRERSSSQEGTQGITQPCNSYAEEKQLFPSSFKICDLNLMGGSDVRDNHNTNSVIGFSSVGQAKQEPVSVDFDLTMNSSCDITDRHGKGVEVIDLDCDSMQEDDDNDNDNNNSERREEAIFTGLESFPDSMQRVSDMPGDGYGLMISELLEADIPNSSVSTGVNSLHNEMSLPTEEGMLGDDESIYMSLGEIPISFVPVWDQQPQGYDKRY
ncbi:hypothetical protein L1987_85292 [Smallanthus sonchifolius]|uniref:Uncharacterized protein n=1 Tax=Smallanthus sonchifolius TaxID=185202 RepID=A0ACB8XXB2_9ASTR|nr:hypothetical protein L1987_85292 [Smallanthus sonchifolius]